MSSAATAWAWQQRVGKKKALLLALADLADDRGCTRTPIDTLAEMAECHRTTVIRQLQELEEDGLIEREDARATNGTQLVSRTRLLMGDPMPTSAESQPATPTRKSSISIPSQNATRPGEAPEKAESQNATHKGKDTYSLLGTPSLTTNINTSGCGAAMPVEEAVRVVDAAGLRQVWHQWVRLGRLARVTQEVQIVEWAFWVREGRADALRAKAQQIIGFGSYTHPAGVLKSHMNASGGPAKSSAPGAPGGPPPGDRREAPALCPGERRRAPDGNTWTVECLAGGLVIFEELAAPLDVPASVVADWVLEGGE